MGVDVVTDLELVDFKLVRELANVRPWIRSS